jgi:KTSC domain-containing protein
MRVMNALEWVLVESTVFSAAAYRADVRQLYLRFADGDIYRYFDCPVSVYTEFLAAESKGRYFSQNIRNRFRDDLVHRHDTSRNDTVQACLAEQLSRSVVQAKARAVQKRDAAHAAGVQE